MITSAQYTGYKMEREERYIVIKKSDLEGAIAKGRLVSFDADRLNQILESIRTQRYCTGKEPLKTIVIESDWPEYERVWKMIEARVEGLIEEDIDTLRRKAQAFDMITDLMGYVQNGTDSIVTLFQDDATLNYWVKHRNLGKPNYDWQEYGPSLQAAVKLAYEKHGGE